MSSTPDRECRRLLRQISAYLDGELDAIACASMERHCESCAECRRVVDGLRHIVSLCRNAGAAPLPESVRARARASVQALLARDDQR